MSKSSMMNTSAQVADFENMLSLDNPITSVQTRWERKAKQASELQDRYIPNRSGTDFDLSQYSSSSDENLGGNEQETSSDYAKLLAANTKNDGEQDTSSSRILAFKNKAPAPKDGYQNSLKVLYSQQGGKKNGEVLKPSRHIPSTPLRILDAPDMLDDYYLNLLSWSSTNTLAVALSQSVYLWDAGTGCIKELMKVEQESDDYIASG
jgi:cell division cycle protein 20 (cofactor of APC complex)